MSDLMVVLATTLLVRVLPLLSYSTSKGRVKWLTMLAMKLPVLLLADIWYRGCFHSVPGIAQYLLDHGWWSDQWPTSHLTYIRYIVIPIFFVLTLADAELMAFIFVDIVGDSCSLWLFYAISQQFLRPLYDIQHVTSVMSFTPMCVAMHPYVSPYRSECVREQPIFAISNQRHEVISLVTAAAVFVLIHHWTSIARRLRPTCIDPVLSLSLLFVVAPLMLLCGLPNGLVSWTNWIACQLVAFASGLSLFMRVCSGINAMYARYKKVSAELCQRGVSFADVLWNTQRLPIALSWLAIIIVASTSSTSSLSLALRNSLASSPFAFYGLCVVAAYIYCIIPQLFASFIGMTFAGFNVAPYPLHGNAMKLIFWEGAIYYLFGMPVHLSVATIYITQIPAIVFMSTKLMRNHVINIPQRYVSVRLLIADGAVCSIPVGAMYSYYYIYGCSSSAFITVLPSLSICINMLGSLVKNIAIAVDSWPRVCMWDNINEVTRTIETGTKYAAMLYGCCLVAYAVIVCLVANWAWYTLTMAAIVFYMSVWSPYQTLAAVEKSRRQLATKVFELSMPQVDNIRLEDVCPICLTALDSVQSRVTSCGHVFHLECLICWAEVKQTCPTCQRLILADDSMKNIQQQTHQLIYQPH